ncbi:MAG: hypothetical protein EZS28_025254, partial [Streblomastix strix]
EGTKDEESYSWIILYGNQVSIKGTIVKNQGLYLFTQHELSKVTGVYNASHQGAIITINGKRLYPMGNLKFEVYEEGKEDETLITLGIASLVEDDQYINTEKELNYLLPLELEEYKEKLWILRIKNGYGEEGVISEEFSLKIK